MIWHGMLVIWTLFALVWWLIAIFLVAKGRERRRYDNSACNSQLLSIFKPLAGPLTQAERLHLSRCLETFVVDMDENSELIIGCHKLDQIHWQQFIESVYTRFPKVNVKLVVDADPGRFAANPKISWMQILAPHASGDLWYWSDADIEAPPGTLKSLRDDFAAANVQLVTSPYSIQEVSSCAALLDALFVNLEFYPGVLLLSKFNAIEFGFGSGMLFHASAFRHKVDWEYLGSCLADDYHLGRIMQPVKLASMNLVTTPAAETWRGALLHYYRWQKTIRWNRPGGFAAQLLVMPLLGWLVALSLMPTEVFAWWGLVVTLLLDVAAAVVICQLLNCRISMIQLTVIPMWSFVRSVVWLTCWLPLPIVWRGRKWWSAYQSLPSRDTPKTNKGLSGK